MTWGPVRGFGARSLGVVLRNCGHSQAGLTDGQQTAADNACPHPQYDAIENKPQFFLTVGASLVGVWFASVILSAVDHVPIVSAPRSLRGDAVRSRRRDNGQSMRTVTGAHRDLGGLWRRFASSSFNRARLP